MIEPASTPPARNAAPVAGSAELLLLTSLALLCGLLGGLLHFVAEVPAATSALTALASLSLLLAGNAMMRRASAITALNEEINHLRSEIAGLRTVRAQGAPIGASPRQGDGAASMPPRGRTGIEPDHDRPMSVPRMPPATAPIPGDATARTDSVPPFPAASASPASSTEVRPRAGTADAPVRDDTQPDSAEQKVAEAPAARSAPPQQPQPDLPGEGELPTARLDWSLRPGTHREPKVVIPVAPPPEGATGPLPLFVPPIPAAHPPVTVLSASESPATASVRAGEPGDERPAAAAVPHSSVPARVGVDPSADARSENSVRSQPAFEGPSSPAMAPAGGEPAPASVAAPASALPSAVPDTTADDARDPLDGLQIPVPDGAPHAMPRVGTAAWPQAVPKTPTVPLDLDTMQSLIEQLAGQLESSPGRGTSDAVHAAHPGTPVQPRADAPAAPMATGRAEPPGLPPRHPTDETQLRPARAPAPYGHLALIAEAIEAKRIDVLLEPILGLADRRARHFELSVRMITRTGDELDPDLYRNAAAGTGLLGRIDAAKLSRAADVLQRLRARGSGASLFSSVAGESLADENFGDAFAEILAAEEGQTARLVLTFEQAEARNFTQAHWRAVSDMAEIGLKFAMTDVTDLDMDFEALKRYGFDFIKLDAEVFLNGLPTPSGLIPAADICRHLSELGLGLIVGGIVAEKDLARILGFGALLGQGTLFGGPRSVELERDRRAA